MTMKRLFDVVCSLLGLILLSPIMLITALLIVIEDGGPVLFVQERNGIQGKVFRMYKFRSMCQDADKMHQSLLEKNELDGPAFKIKDDPRLTRVGKFIRKTSIDELPQLVNIIKGEMSIVGPRPLPTYETEQCNDYQKQRLLVKPGLTCYWQCSGRNNISFDEWIEMDLQYIEDASFWIDIKIIFRTIISVLGQKGAY
jgi:exopolysaccharide biosynthesis polyprenyl glycosylphosphotransferase